MKNFFDHARKMILYALALAGLFFIIGHFAIQSGLTKTSGLVDQQTETFLKQTHEEYTAFPLAHTKEWVAFRVAVAKDKAVIEQIAEETGISPRMLVALLVPEQMRLFYSNRDLFESVFSPLKILGNQSQFSWGIYGIKDETARALESHLKTPSSPFYLGKRYEHTLDFLTADPDQERFARLVNEDDRTYSYRYAALYLKQVSSQWEKAGFPIDDKPDILATLWNLGFERSKPHPNPASGGSEIEIHGTIYNFGALAYAFYYSDEMIELFPTK